MSITSGMTTTIIKTTKTSSSTDYARSPMNLWTEVTDGRYFITILR